MSGKLKQTEKEETEENSSKVQGHSSNTKMPRQKEMPSCPAEIWQSGANMWMFFLHQELRRHKKHLCTPRPKQKNSAYAQEVRKREGQESRLSQLSRSSVQHCYLLDWPHLDEQFQCLVENAYSLFHFQSVK